MAEIDSNAVEKFGTDAERDRMFLHIAWEIDKLARVMPEAIPVDDDQAHFLVRALCGRLLRLTSVMMDMSQRESTPERTFAQSMQLILLSGNSQG